MMTIFGRYLFRQSAGALLLILLSLSGVVWIALALRELNIVTSNGQDMMTFLKITTLTLPNLMALIAPIALLIAVIHTLRRLSDDSELIILTASGATIWTVARPLLLLALIVSVAVAAVNHLVSPWSLRELRALILESRSNLIGQAIQPGRFSSPEANLTFHIRDRALNGELLGILMQDQRDPKVTMSYLAERGIVRKVEGASYLYMSTGHIIRREGVIDAPQIIAFDSYAVDLDRFEKPGAAPALRPRERYYTELAHPPATDEDYKRERGFFHAELHERFSSPFYPLTFVMIALAFVGQAHSTRQNRWQAVAFALTLGFAVRVTGLGSNNLVVQNDKFIPLLYGIPLVVILLSLVLIWFKARPRGGLSYGDRASIWIGDQWASQRARLWPAKAVAAPAKATPAKARTHNQQSVQ
jgi:lipopolysaccharide export system permease protein